MRRRWNMETEEMTEPRGSARLVLVPERPVVLFVVAADESTQLQPPHLLLGARESQLAVRYADLRGPPVAVDARHRLPDRIPGRVAAGGADPDVIALRARRIHLEERAAQVVVIPVDDELEVVGVEGAVAPHETRGHSLRAQAVVHPRTHVERVVIVQEAHFGALGW